MAVEEDEVVEGAGDGQRHDGDPHRVDDIALDRSVDEYAVPDVVVVVKVPTNDRRTEVNYDASDVDHRNAKHNAADASARRRLGWPWRRLLHGVSTFVRQWRGREGLLAGAERLAAYHCDDVEGGRRDYEYVGAAEGGARLGGGVAEYARRERDAVDAADKVKD